MKTSTNQTVETRERELIIKRTFEARRELVFEVHSSCEHLKHWWGPRSWPMEECSMDFRVSGRWHFCLRGPNDGDESWGLGLYKEIINPEKIVYIDRFSDKEGKINEKMPGTLVTIQLIDKGDSTEFISTSEFKTAEECREIIEMGAIEGYSETLDRLDEHLAKIQ